MTDTQIVGVASVILLAVGAWAAFPVLEWELRRVLRARRRGGWVR